MTVPSIFQDKYSKYFVRSQKIESIEFIEILSEDDCKIHKYRMDDIKESVDFNKILKDADPIFSKYVSFECPFNDCTTLIVTHQTSDISTIDRFKEYFREHFDCFICNPFDPTFGQSELERVGCSKHYYIIDSKNQKNSWKIPKTEKYDYRFNLCFNISRICRYHYCPFAQSYVSPINWVPQSRTNINENENENKNKNKNKNKNEKCMNCARNFSHALHQHQDYFGTDNSMAKDMIDTQIPIAWNISGCDICFEKSQNNIDKAETYTSKNTCCACLYKFFFLESNKISTCLSQILEFVMLEGAKLLPVKVLVNKILEYSDTTPLFQIIEYVLLENDKLLPIKSLVDIILEYSNANMTNEIISRENESLAKTPVMGRCCISLNQRGHPIYCWPCGGKFCFRHLVENESTLVVGGMGHVKIVMSRNYGLINYLLSF